MYVFADLVSKTQIPSFDFASLSTNLLPFPSSTSRTQILFAISSIPITSLDDSEFSVFHFAGP